jgi:outer membrane protein
MKKLVLIIFVVIATFTANAQTAAKFGYVDTDYILGQIPEYKGAQAELDKTSVQWQKEIEAKYT